MEKNSYTLIIIIAFLIITVLLFSYHNNATLKTFSKASDLNLSGENVSGEFTMHNGVLANNQINEGTKTWSNTNSIDYSNIKAVYSSGWVAGGASSRSEMIQNVNDYGFNAIVLDIKDEAGHLSYDSAVQTAIDIGASRHMIKDIKEVLKEYHENGIYVIGRIVTFKDPTYAREVKEIAYKKEDGTYWTDKNNNYWPNPYNRDCWNYPIELAKEAAELGFDEIQFDYIRFPSSEGKVSQIKFGFDSNTLTKSQIINQFLTRVMDELSDYKVKISADVFGITTRHSGDYENIGQDYKAISQIVDIICPMIYPSHYGRGNYNVSRPDLDPYGIIVYAMKDAQARVSGDSKVAIARPYLQDFTASWLGRGNYQTYGNEAVRDQIQACSDLGIKSFTLWDPSNKYCYEALGMVQMPPWANQ